MEARGTRWRPKGGKWRRGVPKWRPMGRQMGARGTEMEARGGNGGPGKSKRGAKGTQRIKHEAKWGLNGGPRVKKNIQETQREPKTMQVELKDAKIRHASAPNQKGCKGQRRCSEDAATIQRPHVEITFAVVRAKHHNKQYCEGHTGWVMLEAKIFRDE